jgi:hypothetical protein
VPVYENLVIGTFLFALGLKIGAGRDGHLCPDLAVHLTQQTPLDVVLGDVLLTGQTLVALLEFKRTADRRSKERSKLVKIEALLERPRFRGLRTTSQQIHFYVETGDALEKGFSRVLPYLELRTDDTGCSLEQLIDDLAFRARSGPEVDTQACQRYLKLVCRSQGRSYHPSPGLLVGVDGNGRIAFAPVADLRDLRTTFAEIRAQEITLAQEVKDLRLRSVQSISRRLRQTLAR